MTAAGAGSGPDELDVPATLRDVEEELGRGDPCRGVAPSAHVVVRWPREDDREVSAMRRVVVRGSSGSGKTTLARRLAARLDVPHVELDALFHLADWQNPTDEAFRAAVADATREDGWVADGNYDVAVDVLRPRADTLVVLDLPRPLVMRRLVWRTLSRGLLRRELWNGNRERATGMFRRDPEDNVVLYAWRTFDRRHRDAQAAPADPAWAHAHVVVLRSPAEVDDFLAAVPQPP